MARRSGGITRRVTFCHLSQLLSYPAVLCELAMAIRVFPAVVPPLAVFGYFVIRPCAPLMTICGSFEAVSRRSLRFNRYPPQSIDLLTGAQCLFGEPSMRVKFSLVAGCAWVISRVLLGCPQY